MSISLQHAVKYVTVALFLLVGAMLTMPQPAAADFDIPPGGVELEGFAWGAYTQGAGLAGIGWISMNCSNTDTCGTSNYKVQLNTSGDLTGYAWSSTVGWISFNPAGADSRSGAGVEAASARATEGSFSDNLNFGGWARVCSVAANPATCSGGMHSNAGGWDGWIALSGTAAGGYGITMTPTGAANEPNNYAWGGLIVAGWIDFSPNGTTPVTYSEIPAPPQVTFNCPDTSSAIGVDVTCTYTVDDATSCQLTNDQGEPTSSPSASGNSLTVSPATSTTYTLVCTNAEGPSTPADELIEIVLPVAPNPVVDFTVPDIVRSGRAADVGITVTSAGGSTCSLFGPGLTGTPEATFTVPADGSYTDTFQTANLTNRTNIAIECTVVNGSPYRQAAEIEVTGTMQEI